MTGAVMIALMVVIGGITRLTESGLSIVEWQPILGALPPLSQADWEALFAKYRQTPEFRLVNFDMEQFALKDFKAGDTVFKYNCDIGKVVAPIRAGEHVHVHNIKTKRWKA